MAETKIENKEVKDGAPAASSAASAQVIPPKEGEQDIDFDKELASLENDGAPAAPIAPAPKGKTPEEERQQAEFTLKSVSKRVKELGGDPTAVIADGVPAPAPKTEPVDTSNFVTKTDLALAEAQKIARSPGEVKVIMWYVKNKGMSVEDGHLLANKGRVRTAFAEIMRKNTTTASPGGGGPGEAQRIQQRDGEPTPLDAATVEKLQMSGKVYDPAKKAYVGKRSQLVWKNGQWVDELIPKQR